MRFVNFKIKNYKQISDLSLSFKTGLNIIFGNNEAGKSTITQALLTVIFISPDKNNKQITQMASWQTKELPILELQFEHENKQWKLVKDFQHKEASLTFVGADGQSKTIDGIPEIQETILQILPLNSEGMYKKTAYITADSIAAIHNDDTGFMNSLQNAAVSGSSPVQVNTILEKLHKQRDGLLVGMKRYSGAPGLVKSTADNVEDCRKELNEMQVSLKEAQNNQLSLQNIEQQLQESQNILAENQLLVEDNEKILRWLQDKAKLETEFSEVQNDLDIYDSLKTKIAKVDTQIVELPNYNWEELAQDLSLYQTNVAALNLIQKSGVLETAKSRKSRRTPQKQQLLLIILAIIVAGILLALILHNNLPWLIALIASLILSAYIWQSSKQSSPRENVSDINALAELEKQKNELLLKYNVASLAELSRFIEQREHLDKIDTDLQSKIALLKERKPEAEINNRAKLISRQLRVIADNLEDIHADSIKLTSSEFSKRANEMKIAKEKIDNLGKERVRLDTILKNNPADLEQVSALEEKLTVAEEAYQKAKDKVTILDIVIVGLEKSIKGTAEAAAALVESEVEKYLPTLTQGRYSKCRLEKDLSLKVYSEAKKDWCLCETLNNELSRGTVDQVYLITRLAFIKLLAKDKPLPIIMDDPLLTFDHSRKLLAMDILREFAATFQVIFFTFDADLTPQTSLS